MSESEGERGRERERERVCAWLSPAACSRWWPRPAPPACGAQPATCQASLPAGLTAKAAAPCQGCCARPRLLFPARAPCPAVPAQRQHGQDGAAVAHLYGRVPAGVQVSLPACLPACAHVQVGSQPPRHPCARRLPAWLCSSEPPLRHPCCRRLPAWLCAVSPSRPPQAHRLCDSY